MHQNALRETHTPPYAKTQAGRNLSRRAFYGIRTNPTRVWKIVRRRFTPQTYRMHYMTYESQWMQKHKFGATCPITLSLEFVPVPLEQEK
jgi:hypothetical protein